MASGGNNSNSNDDWKEAVKRKLIGVFEKDPEALVRILWYLDEEETAYKNDLIGPVWKTLKVAINAGEAFKKYAERLAEDTKTAEKDTNFRKTMNSIYSQMMDPSENPLPKAQSQGFEILMLAKFDTTQASTSIGFCRALTLIPRQSQLDIIRNVLPRFMASQTVSMVDEVVTLVHKTGGDVVMVALAALQLGYAAIINIRRYCNGEITGRRCSKNIVDSIFSVGGAISGGVAGSLLGSSIGPIGTLVGGILGGLITAQTAQFLSDRLTQVVFGIPKEEALENAYNYFGVKMTASNSDINLAYRKLCLQHHPDKGGKTEDFILVQVNMGIIKANRGEL